MEPLIGVVGVGVVGNRPAQAVHRGVDASGVAGRRSRLHEVADEDLGERIREEALLGGPDGIVIALRRETELREVVGGVHHLLSQGIEFVGRPRVLRGGGGEWGTAEPVLRRDAMTFTFLSRVATGTSSPLAASTSS